jgi:hypothetical protein
MPLDRNNKYSTPEGLGRTLSCSSAISYSRARGSTRFGPHFYHWGQGAFYPVGTLESLYTSSPNVITLGTKPSFLTQGTTDTLQVHRQCTSGVPGRYTSGTPWVSQAQVTLGTLTVYQSISPLVHHWFILSVLHLHTLSTPWVS